MLKCEKEPRVKVKAKSAVRHPENADVGLDVGCYENIKPERANVLS
jgi:hypothetical protein